MALCPKRAERGVVWPARGYPLQGTARKEKPMRLHRTHSTTLPDTHKYINDYINDISDIPPRLSLRRATRFSTALLALALGLGLAILVMLGTWLSLSTRATARGTTFVAHPEEQTLSADELADMGLSPTSIEDILTRF